MIKKIFLQGSCHLIYLWLFNVKVGPLAEKKNIITDNNKKMTIKMQGLL